MRTKYTLADVARMTGNDVNLLTSDEVGRRDGARHRAGGRTGSGDPARRVAKEDPLARKMADRARVQAAARSMLAAITADCALRGIRARVVSNVPNTLAALLMAVEVDAIGPIIPVSGENSARTLFGEAGNARVRAWHAAEHAEGRLPFALAGEVIAATRAVARLRTRGASPDALILADVEIRGQVSYRARHGAFPVDQVSFALHAFRYGLRAAVERGGF